MKITQRICLLLSALLTFGIFAQDDDDPVIRAMKDEMQRSMNELQMDDSPKPYFIAYTIFDNSFADEQYTLGTAMRNVSQRNRYVRVELRVGSYELDNTNYRPRGNRPTVITQYVPVSDDYEEVRRSLWRATDTVYKNAAQNYSSKLTALENRSDKELDNDFTQEEPFVLTADGEADLEGVNLEALKDTALALSAMFLDYPEIYTSLVSATVAKRRMIYVNSEGSFFDINEERCRTRTVAFTQAVDGTEHQDYSTEYSINCNDVASYDEMQPKVQAMIERLTALREAESPDDVYNGPVLFEGQAAAEIVRSFLLPRLSATRLPISDDPRSDAMLNRNPFLDRIGRRVISADVNVYNDSTLSEFNGFPLVGKYSVDQQGVPAQRTTLIEGGRLQTLLTSRAPVDEFNKSSGSSRLGGYGMPSNILVLPNEEAGLTKEQMMEEMNVLIDDYGLEYGLVIRKLANPAELVYGNRTSYVLEAYKVYPDGREVLVPSIEIAGFTDRSLRDRMLRDIVAISQDVELTNTVYGGGGVWSALISIASPSLLFEELTVPKMRPVSPKPPVVPHPATDGSALSN